MRWAGHVALTRECRGADRVLEGKLEGRRPFGRPKHILEQNIKIDVKEVR
jgi:hypothetical protein